MCVDRYRGSGSFQGYILFWRESSRRERFCMRENSITLWSICFLRVGCSALMMPLHCLTGIFDLAIEY